MRLLKLININSNLYKFKHKTHNTKIFHSLRRFCENRENQIKPEVYARDTLKLLVGNIPCSIPEPLLKRPDDLSKYFDCISLQIFCLIESTGPRFHLVKIFPHLKFEQRFKFLQHLLPRFVELALKRETTRTIEDIIMSFTDDTKEQKQKVQSVISGALIKIILFAEETSYGFLIMKSYLRYFDNGFDILNNISEPSILRMFTNRRFVLSVRDFFDKHGFDKFVHFDALIENFDEVVKFEEGSRFIENALINLNEKQQTAVAQKIAENIIVYAGRKYNTFMLKRSIMLLNPEPKKIILKAISENTTKIISLDFNSNFQYFMAAAFTFMNTDEINKTAMSLKDRYADLTSLPYYTNLLKLIFMKVTGEAAELIASEILRINVLRNMQSELITTLINIESCDLKKIVEDKSEKDMEIKKFLQNYIREVKGHW